MTLVICPGVHNPTLSDRFVEALQTCLQLATPDLPKQGEQPSEVLPTDEFEPYDAFSVWSYWQMVAEPQAPLFIISFSAGVVGAIAAAQLWQGQGKAIAAFIAVDGWGVPQMGNFPFYRVSHDHFTHWSSALLGAGQDSFYATPSVEHLDLWQFPDQAQGLWIAGSQTKPVTAIEFITQMLLRHGCRPLLVF